MKFCLVMNLKRFTILVRCIRFDDLLTRHTDVYFFKQFSRELVAEHMNRRSAQNRGFPLLLRQRLNKLIPVQSEEPEPSISSNKRKGFLGLEHITIYSH